MIIKQLQVQLVSATVVLVLLSWALRSPARAKTAVPERLVYRMHPAVSILIGVAGLIVIGIFTFGMKPHGAEGRAVAEWGAAIYAAFTVFGLMAVRFTSVMIDGDLLVLQTLLLERSVELRKVEGIASIGHMVELKLRVDPRTQKRPRNFAFPGLLRGLGELLATIRERTSSPS